ncbi:hypothetical protein [Vreelandella janggokensis]|uniref:hypothetical protein n=1 Tax=Vreelandella janggokensis TaxID=370767 RepID=UPI0028574E16|nr:hypothetical protein [Halomonas janggokensis]MDR5886532.1 hypothetical protein [Halomonas janggokensis]
MLGGKDFCTKKLAFLISLLTSLVAAVALLAFFVFFASPGLVNKVIGFNFYSLYSGFFECKAGGCQYLSGPMNNFEDVGVEDVWAFQTSLYQTVITFLIAINGLIAALSIMYIKSNSEEKAEDAAKNYVKGEGFGAFIDKKLSKISKKKLKQVQKDYSSTVEELEFKIYDMNDVEIKVKRLENENNELKRQIGIISKKIAELDSSESDGNSLELNRGK